MSISQGKVQTFLVHDKSLRENDAPFFKWLRSEGFRYGWCKGHYEVCSWAFVDITRKLYACGMPGVEITPPIGNHAITIPEFMTIYTIYKKYEGMGYLVFPDGQSSGTNG